MGVGRESGRGKESAWGNDSGWAARIDRQEEWMSRECEWARRVDGAGRLEKAGTVDGAGRIAQLNFFFLCRLLKVFTESFRTLPLKTLRIFL